MEVININIDKLIPYVNNSRIHSEKQITQIASSIKEFGFTNPLLLDENKGIIAGHGRLEACKKLDIKEVPCIIISGLTEAQKKALIIADNKLADNSGWDNDLLSLEIDNLKELDFDVDILGFDDEELNSLLMENDEFDESLFDEQENIQEDSFKLTVTLKTEDEKKKLKEDLLSRGFLCQ